MLENDKKSESAEKEDITAKGRHGVLSQLTSICVRLVYKPHIHQRGRSSKPNAHNLDHVRTVKRPDPRGLS